MAEEQGNATGARSFLACARAVARLLAIEDVGASVPESRRARRLAAAVRKPLLESENLPEEFFAPLMAAAVYDLDPSHCRWFVEPALYAFGRRRVRAALVDYLRTGTEDEQAGATRAWYCSHLPLRASRSPAYGRVPGRDVADHGPSLPLWSRPVRAAASRRAITAGPGPASLNRASSEGDSGRDLRIPSA